MTGRKPENTSVIII